jgi:tetratricopeptide (TPR) repeat protein
MVNIYSACGLLVAAVLVACAPASSQSWVEVKTPNFRVVSNASERRTVKLARELESFRAAVLELVGMQVAPGSMPTDVYLIDSDRVWRETSHREGVSGYFRATWRRHVMAIQGGEGEMETVLHEYVHKLLADSGAAYPRWYDEGLAGLLQTAKVRVSSIEIGRPPARLGVLRMMAPNRFGPSAAIGSHIPRDRHDPDRIAEDEFYSRSWARVSYLFLGDLAGERDRRLEVGRFLELFNAGVPHDEAFARAFGTGPEQFDEMVEAYLAAGRFPWIKIGVETPAEHTFQTRQMPPAVVSRELGVLSLDAGRLDDAAVYFERARAHGQDAQALSGLARIRARKDDHTEARRLFEAAVALDPRDPIPRLDYATFLLSNTGVASSGTAARDLEAARAHLGVALEVAPHLPEGHALLGLYHLQAGDAPAVAGAAFVRAADLLPGDAFIAFHLGRLYAEVGQTDDARALLRIVHGRPHLGALSERAGELLAELDRKEASLRGYPGSELIARNSDAPRRPGPPGPRFAATPRRPSITIRIPRFSDASTAPICRTRRSAGHRRGRLRA